MKSCILVLLVVDILTSGYRDGNRSDHALLLERELSLDAVHVDLHPHGHAVVRKRVTSAKPDVFQAFASAYTQMEVSSAAVAQPSSLRSSELDISVVVVPLGLAVAIMIVIFVNLEVDKSSESASGGGNFYVSVLPPRNVDLERIPGFDAPPAVALLLPTASQDMQMRMQEQRSVEYHLLCHTGYNLQSPLDFDADAFIEASVSYCRERKVSGIVAYDCFSTLLASIVRQELGLPGPSFQSTFLCCNKFYMRKNLTPELEVVVPPSMPSQFPSVIKLSDTQFYVGTKLVHDAADWDGAWAEINATLLARGVLERKSFYFKWATRFGWANEFGWSAPADVQLIHVEPFLTSIGEFQAEVVAMPDGTMTLADTGDIEHGIRDAITLFKTPGTFTLTPTLTSWLKSVAQQLINAGYMSAAMDIEFVKLPGTQEIYQLIEINSRYSYMGNFIHYSHDHKATVNEKHELQQGEHEVRNLLNRTRLALGVPPAVVPSRDNKGICKLAAMIYTDRVGTLDTFFDDEELQAMINNGTIDAFAHKPVYTKKVITERDRLKFAGWAKIGVALITMEDDTCAINKRLDEVLGRLFKGASSGFMPIKLVDEDGDNETGLRPSALTRPSALEKAEAFAKN